MGRVVNSAVWALFLGLFTSLQLLRSPSPVLRRTAKSSTTSGGGAPSRRKSIRLETKPIAVAAAVSPGVKPFWVVADAEDQSKGGRRNPQDKSNLYALRAAIVAGDASLGC
ncbi:hypothetical protein NL676_001051 [Syzygium grande]|nr:hypothetical protein NL676_001051 [Syzygium grande]